MSLSAEKNSSASGKWHVYVFVLSIMTTGFSVLLLSSIPTSFPRLLVSALPLFQFSYGCGRQCQFYSLLCDLPLPVTTTGSVPLGIWFVQRLSPKSKFLGKRIKLALVASITHPDSQLCPEGT